MLTGSEVLERRAGDEDDWREWRGKGDPIMHIELRKWADVLLVAPMSANSLAKAAQGLCDNLLTCILRAWDFSKPCLVSQMPDLMPFFCAQVHVQCRWIPLVGPDTVIRR